MNPLLIGGGVVGGLWLLELGKAAPPPQAESAGDASTAAANALRARMPIAAGTVTLSGGVTSDQSGISWTVDPAKYYSANANYIAMRDAMVGAFGQVPGATIAPIGLSTSQLADIMTAWLIAYDAGRAANHQNFALTTAEAQGTASTGGGQVVGWATCATSSESDRTSIGNAACAVASYRDYIGAMDNQPDSSYQYTIETFRLVNALASEMDGADYTTPGVRNTDQNPNQWGQIPGAVVAGLEAAGSAVGSGVASLAGGILNSNLAWLVVLGFGAYMVLR